MRTLKFILTLTFFMSLLFAQTDSTETSNDTTLVESETTVPTTPEPETTTAIADSLDMASDSSMVEMIADSTLADSMFVAEEDTVAAPEPEMVLVPNDPTPASLAGLMNEGPVYYWSNDHLDGLGLEGLDYLTLVDPAPIAIKANDCLDIVCHLLASDSTGLDYVIVGADDSTALKVYDTETKVVILEAMGDSLTAALDAYLRELAGEELIAVYTEPDTTADSAMVMGPVYTPPADSHREKAMKIRNRQFRDMVSLTSNPANLARDFDAFTTWNILPDVSVNVRNSLLTPGWYNEWWTTGIDLDEGTNMEDYLSTLVGQDMLLTIVPEFKTLFGFRIGRFALNLAGMTHIDVNLPGELIATPMRSILFDEPIENGGLAIEILPFVAKSTLAYAHPVETPFGNLKLGLGLNIFEAAGYVNMTSNDFTIVTGTDSVIVTASGEGWATLAGADGKLDDPNTDDLEVGDALSSPSIGLDLGVILDLQPLLKQEVEVQLALNNIGAKYEWSNITHQAWTYELRMPAPDPQSEEDVDMEEYETTETVDLGTEETYTLELPTVFNLSAFYQPIPMVLIGGGIQKAMTDENVLGYSSDLAINYQVNVFPVSFWDLSYYKTSYYGDPVHTFGSGFHFGFLETGLTVSFHNGLNTDAKGIGFGLNSSLHF